MSETADATADAPPAACVPVSGFPDVTGYRRGVFVSLFAVWSQHSSSYQRDTIDTDSITLDRVTPFALSPTTISVVGLWWGWCVNPERIHLSPCPFGVWVNATQSKIRWRGRRRHISHCYVTEDRDSSGSGAVCAPRCVVADSAHSGRVRWHRGLYRSTMAPTWENNAICRNIRVHTIYITGHHEGHQGHAQTQHVLSLPHARLLHRCFPCGSYSDDTW